MFEPTHAWVDSMLDNLVKMWGYFPTLEPEDVLAHLGSHTYNLRAAQKAIERHLWGKDVDADVSVKFIPLPIPGLIKSYQFWDKGRIQLKMEIEVSEDYRHNPIDQMNILAHEYAHAFHFLRSDFIAPKDNMEYEHLTDLSTIALGMGLLTLQGRGADGLTRYIGYMPLELLKYAQARYQSLKGKVPPASERPRTTIRPGKDKKWEYVEPEFTVPTSTPPVQKPPVPKLHWTEAELFATIPHSNTVVPLRSGEVIGRTFVKSHFKDSSNVNQVSREQLQLTLSSKKLTIKNTGKHSLKVKGTTSRSFFGFTIKQRQKWNLESGQELLVSRPPVMITMPDGSSFSIGLN